VAGVSAVRALTASQHTCAILADETVTCWGRNDQGQLGDGSTMSRDTPKQVPELKGVTEVAAGGLHTCALLSDGTVACWGANYNGQLGDPSVVSRRAQPGPVPGLVDVVHLAAGLGETCAVLKSGAVSCWGANRGGQLGNGTMDDKPNPTPVQQQLGPIARVSLGVSHACALGEDTKISCWGADDLHQLGDDLRQTSLYPKLLTSVAAAVQLAAGDAHNCVVSGGDVLCWGNNATGQLGDGTLSPHGPPAPAQDLAGRVASVSAGQGFTCTVLLDGDARCWGSNMQGQLGDGTTVDRYVPTRLAW
jgi:alpha-tubulin suppressor-like RCC1 family protein